MIVEKKNEPTEAQKFFKDKIIITERPKGMDFKKYREILKLQSKAIRKICAKAPNQNLSIMWDLRVQPLPYWKVLENMNLFN